VEPVDENEDNEIEEEELNAALKRVLMVFATNSFEIFQNQIILFALILKVITSICNETIFHLIVKSTVDILCGVGIV
jgi:hypothetical protein